MTDKDQTIVTSGGHGRFPWSHVIGYIFSLVLTLVALLMVTNHVASGGMLLFVILLLATIQIFIQLFFFMHITEKHGPAYHIITLAVALFFTFAIIAGSLWIMTFTQVSS